MAHATALTSPPQPPVPVVFGYELDLDVAEANVIYDILRRVGGSPTASRRGIAERVLMALKAAGVRGIGTDDVGPENRAIYFADSPHG